MWEALLAYKPQPNLIGGARVEKEIERPRMARHTPAKLKGVRLFHFRIRLLVVGCSPVLSSCDSCATTSAGPYATAKTFM